MKSVKGKIAVTFGIILIFIALLVYTGTSQIQKMNSFTEETINKWMLGLQAMDQIELDLTQYMYYYTQTLIVQDVNELAKLNEKTDQLLLQINEGIANYNVFATTAEEQALYAQVQETWQVFEEGMKNLTEGKVSQDDYAATVTAITDAFYQITAQINTFSELYDAGIATSNSDRMDVVNESRTIYMIIGIVVFLIICIQAISLILIITRPLAAATTTMNHIANGNLSIPPLEVKQKDEFGIMLQAANRTLNNLKESVTNIQSASKSVADSSTQMLASSEQNSHAAEHISDSIQQVASGSEDQANTALECGRVMEEMAEGVTRIAQTTSEIADITKRSASISAEGSVKMNNVTDGIRSLSESVKETSYTISQLEAQTEHIGDISTLIGQISAQTNLLALNANIEAARAGEHGRGFAVVANEIRKLATQSDASAKSIMELIDTIQKDTKLAAAAMSESQTAMEHNVSIVFEAQQAFNDIAQSTVDVSARIEEAAAAAEQLAASSEEVAASIASMGSIAKQTAEMSQQVAAATEEQLASTEEMTASSQSLSAIANDLNELTKQFKL